MPRIQDPDDAALGGGIGSEVNAVTDAHQRIFGVAPTFHAAHAARAIHFA